jgi:hypothetical protein
MNDLLNEAVREIARDLYRQLGSCQSESVYQTKQAWTVPCESDRWASPVVFGPRTLRRTRGGRNGKVRCIPHLAKNERDMGHPGFCCGA